MHEPEQPHDEIVFHLRSALEAVTTQQWVSACTACLAIGFTVAFVADRFRVVEREAAVVAESSEPLIEEKPATEPMVTDETSQAETVAVSVKVESPVEKYEASGQRKTLADALPEIMSMSQEPQTRRADGSVLERRGNLVEIDLGENHGLQMGNAITISAQSSYSYQALFVSARIIHLAPNRSVAKIDGIDTWFAKHVRKNDRAFVMD